MDWNPGQMSEDVEDRRGDSGGGGGFNFSGGGLGMGGVVVLIVISLVTGRNFIGSYLSGGGVQQSRPAPTINSQGLSQSAEEDRSAHLVSFVLDDVQKTWPSILSQQGCLLYT